MADDVMGKAAADAESVSANGAGTSLAVRQSSRADRARNVAYRSRFTPLYVALAVIAGVGVGALLVLVGGGSPAPTQAWSAWEPAGSLDQQAAQIAEHVSDTYRLPSGRPLVGVKAGPPTVTFEDGSTFTISAIAVQPGSTGGSAESDIDTFDAARSVMYKQCGTGRGCVIPDGAPSVARGQLLRRQALELALYSFRHLDGIESTLVLLPPDAAGRPTSVFFVRDEVRAELGRPLAETLPAPLTPGVGEITTDEQRVIDRLTASRVYQYDAFRTQDGSAVYALAPDLSE